MIIEVDQVAVVHSTWVVSKLNRQEIRLNREGRHLMVDFSEVSSFAQRPLCDANGDTNIDIVKWR